MFNIFKQYKGLRKELYVLFFGRTVTSLGAMIQPLLTLILSSKLHLDAASIALLLLFFSLIGIPATYLAGYLADRYSKRNLIIIFDIITVVCYVVCGFIPMGTMSIFLVFIGSLFAQMEHPIYDAFVADLSSNENREKAYSLNYLGMNLGFVLAPTLGGMLFEHHLYLVFILSGLATLSSTILIYLLIKDVHSDFNDNVIFEHDDKSIIKLLKKLKIIIYFILCNTLTHVIYNQSLFLLPLNLEYLHNGDTGAFIYGTLSSLNALIVCIGTPILTLLSYKIKDISKIMIGIMLYSISFVFFISEHRIIPFYYIHMFIFTIGEIFNTLGAQPYLTKRIPAHYRGRISGLSRMTSSICTGISQYIVGYCIDHLKMTYIWIFFIIVGIITLSCLLILKNKDMKEYPLL